MSKYTITITDEPQTKEVKYQRGTFEWQFILPNDYDVCKISIETIKSWLSGNSPEPITYIKTNTQTITRSKISVRDYDLEFYSDGFIKQVRMTYNGSQVALSEADVIDLLSRGIPVA